MHKNNADDPNLWVSEAGCDLNTAEGYKKVVEAVRALGVVPDVITVDTLHRFMAGDENSSQDAKTMLDACAALMAEFNCTVILVHHTGVSDEAQHRARGSSAWRGALDIEISIIPAKDDQPMEIVQRKAKDSEMADAIYVNLVSMNIPGWFDEDGDPVTTATIEQTEAGEKKAGREDSSASKHKTLFQKAWFATGAEMRDDVPYVSRSGLKDKLISDSYKERTVTNMLNRSEKDKLIGFLTNSGAIDAFEHGWLVTDEVWASAMRLGR
jgi:KaiC/GvpD/RAD55 family RecA-like ATPase